MPTDEGLRWFEANEEALAGVPFVAFGMRACVEAMVGNFDSARALVKDGRARLAELGQRLWLAGTGLQLCAIEGMAVRSRRWGACRHRGVRGASEALGERGWLSTLAGQTALALVELGRDEEAEHWIEVARDAGKRRRRDHERPDPPG